MKATLFILSFFLIVPTLMGQRYFTLGQAVSYAREHHPGLANSRLDQQISITGEERLERRWHPQVAASAQIRYNPILQTTLLPSEITGGTAGEFTEVQFGTAFSSATGLTVRQKVYDPVFYLDRELQSIARERAELDEAFHQGEVELRATAAYYQVLLNREAWENSRSLLASLGQLLEDVQVRVDNELENQSRLNTVNQQYRQQQARVYADSLNWQSSLAGLKLELHFPAGEELLLTDTLRLPMDDTLSLNTADNYDIRTYGLQLEESRNELERLHRSRLPTVDAEGYLGAQFFSQSPDLYNFNRWYGISYIGLTASLPLYDGQDRRYGAQVENLKIEQVRHEMEAYRITQENKAARAALQLESARVEARLARRAIETGEKNLELARFNYRNDVAGFQPVFDALQNLVDSRGQLINARAAYVQALLNARLLDL